MCRCNPHLGLFPFRFCFFPSTFAFFFLLLPFSFRFCYFLPLPLPLLPFPIHPCISPTPFRWTINRFRHFCLFPRGCFPPVSTDILHLHVFRLIFSSHSFVLSAVYDSFFFSRFSNRGYCRSVSLWDGRSADQLKVFDAEVVDQALSLSNRRM